MCLKANSEKRIKMMKESAKDIISSLNILRLLLLFMYRISISFGEFYTQLTIKYPSI